MMRRPRSVRTATIELPGSPGWTALGGWAGFLRTYHLAGPLRWLPAVAAAPLIILALFVIGALPRWRHSSNWGYYPSGGLGIVLIVVVVLVLAGRI